MQIKRYTIASLVFVALVGWFVHAFVTNESVAINFFGTTLPSLPIALWVIVPLVVLYVATVAHMLFHSLISILNLRKYKKDHQTLVDAIVDAYLGKKNRSHKFKTDRYKLLGTIVDNATILPLGELEVTIDNKKISEVIDAINRIKDGEVIELKKYSLPISNEFVIKNERNRYKKGDISAESIISSTNKYDITLVHEVYVDFVKDAPFYAIEKYKKYLTKDALFEILSRVNSDKNTLEISNESLMSLFGELELSSDDYIKASQKLSRGMIPEQRIKLFEMLSVENENTIEAYLFTLFDLEMLDPAKEILDNSQNGEFIYFKAYSSLRDCGKHFDINLFM